MCLARNAGCDDRLEKRQPGDMPAATSASVEEGWSELYLIGGALAAVFTLVLAAGGGKKWRQERDRRKADAEAESLRQQPRLFEKDE